jgi:CDP-diacylglycerol---serine O-phosphatidyltransferase
MRKLTVLPNLITAFGLVCGLFSIFRMISLGPEEPLYPVLLATAVLLLVAGVADVLDGIVARLMRAESDFGLFFDSLADAVTFGVAPAVIVVKSLGLNSHSLLFYLLLAGAIIYSACGVLRLVRYNVTSLQKRGLPDQTPSSHFTGLPIPAAACTVVSSNLLLSVLAIGAEQRALILLSILVVIGYFMISRWKFPSVRALRWRLPSFALVLTAALVTVLSLYGFLHYFPLTLALTCWTYVITAWVLACIRLIAGRQSKTLEEFEPEPEEEELPA